MIAESGIWNIRSSRQRLYGRRTVAFTAVRRLDLLRIGEACVESLPLNHVGSRAEICAVLECRETKICPGELEQ